MSAITGHGLGANGQQPVNLILAQDHQSIPLRALVVSHQPVARRQQVSYGDPEVNADRRRMQKKEKAAALVIQPAANSRGSDIDQPAGCDVGQAMISEH